MAEPATPVLIDVNHVSKKFKLPHERTSSIKGAVLNFYRRRRSYEMQRALKDVSFKVREGEFFGIVGRNGSGKSTMLKMLAGIYEPTTGTIQVHGKLTPFIELGVGFNPELTGRENVFLNGALLGFDRREMAKMYKDIVDFAELHKFMDQKLKNYSSGMQVRLAFSIAIRAQSDILLIDEVLAVGDITFQEKCFTYFRELKRQKKTVILVSHDAAALQKYCDRGILIDNGKVVSSGPISRVINDYNDILNEREEQREAEDESKRQDKKNRWGTRDIEVTAAGTQKATGRDARVFTDKDEIIRVNVTYTARAFCEQPIYGITVSDAAGQQIFVSNSMWLEQNSPDMQPGDTREVQWDIPNIFNSGELFISPAVASRTGYVVYDWRDGFVTFKVRKTLQSTALASVAHHIVIGPNQRGNKSEKKS